MTGTIGVRSNKVRAYVSDPFGNRIELLEPTHEA